MNKRDESKLGIPGAVGGKRRGIKEAAGAVVVVGLDAGDGARVAGLVLVSSGFSVLHLFRVSSAALED